MKGALTGPPAFLEPLAADGVRCVADVLERSECVRDLSERSNHRLRAGGFLFHVKRARRSATPREARAIAQARAAGVPTATLAFSGTDPEHGSLTGTVDLAPAEPLDDWLRRGPGPAPRKAAREELACVVAALHDAGLHHRDLYLCHVFLACEEESVRLALIDWERLGSHRRPLGRRVVKDLAALCSSTPPQATSEREQARFLLRYLRRRGLPPRRVFARLARRIRRKAARIRAHRPRTPVGDAARPSAGSA